MTVIEISKHLGIPPKDIIEYVHANATFPVKRNFQTGELILPVSLDVDAFFAPLLNETQQKNLQQKKRAMEQKIQQEKLAIEQNIQREQKERHEAEKQHSVSIETLKKTGAEGYYQYKAISLLDVGGLFSGKSGRVNVEAMTQTLNALGMEGWHLVTAYSNELGKNALSGGSGGVMLGVNSTVDENILIFERFIRF